MAALPFDRALHEAASLLAQGRPSAARTLLEPMVAAVPHYATALVLLAKAYEAEDNLELALATWHRAHRLAPTSPLIERERSGLLERVVRMAPPPPRPTLPPTPSVAVPPPVVEPFTPTTSRTVTPAVVPPPIAPPPVVEPLAPPPPVFPPPVVAVPEGLPVPEVPEASPPPEPPKSLPSLDFENLDALIAELERAPRIRPDPSFQLPDNAGDDDDEAREEQDLVSETLARIYLTQKKFEEAAKVYEALAHQQPAQRDLWLQKAAEARHRS